MVSNTKNPNAAISFGRCRFIRAGELFVTATAIMESIEEPKIFKFSGCNLQFREIID